MKNVQKLSDISEEKAISIMKFLYQLYADQYGIEIEVNVQKKKQEVI